VIACTDGAAACVVSHWASTHLVDQMVVGTHRADPWGWGLPEIASQTTCTVTLVRPPGAC
jgi:hypothetical protein